MLAIARAEGYALPRALGRLRPAPSAPSSLPRRGSRAALGAVEHKVVAIDLAAFGGSALTDSSIAVPTGGVQPDAIPVTYVPARNTILLSLALAWAEVLDARHIFFGANAVDYSGYPDCRPEFVQRFERLANLATKAAVEGRPLTVRTPIIALTKADIVRRGAALGVDYRAHRVLLPGRRRGPRLRRVRRLPAAPGRVRAAGLPDPTRYFGTPRT